MVTCARLHACNSLCIHVLPSTVSFFVRAGSRVPSSVYAFIKLEGSQSLWAVEDRAHHRSEVGVVGSRPRTRMERRGGWKRTRWRRARRRRWRRRQRRVLRGWWESERGCFSTTSCSRHPQTPLDPGVREGARGRRERENANEQPDRKSTELLSTPVNLSFSIVSLISKRSWRT